ncbi:hypothetical protein [Anaerosphaera multitolerans]|uniref:Uncharacterized protein n=1 Tax=Anaerosphaera multitolerans TaxID=2487351 RepID=A0A437S5S8_9FIRM|nr:hypothetical protein [Anaerosphaera multitolerans]RVU54327.1 hypothetical protein EF514_07730 [Anaerosphaera multitolerans]
MKNNVRGLIFHLIIILIVFIMALLINLSDSLIEIIYGNIIFRTILSLIPIFLYYNFGKAMSKRGSKNLDFFTGNIVFLIAVVLLVFAFLGLKSDVFNTPVAGTMWRFPLDFFLMPQLYIFQMYNIGYNMFTALLAAILPGFLYGVSIKRSRAKILKKKRLMKLRQIRSRRRR